MDPPHLNGNSNSLHLRGLSWPEYLFVVAVALAVTGAVLNCAWLSEDSFITLRYVWNTVHGYGPVFNVGEHVQGYTHPLWFVLLVLGSLIFPNPIWVAYGFSFLFTFLTAAFVGVAVMRAAARFLPGAAVLVLTALVWTLSDPWRSFQTGGLENSLANMIIVGIVWEVWARAASRPGRLMLLLGLVCLTRPDFLVLVTPIAVVLLARVRSIKQFGVLCLALVPVLAWLIFALLFYHDIFPNTFYAKVGIYPNLAVAVSIGWAYMTDWIHFDSFAAGATVVSFVIATRGARTAERIALLAGIALYWIWILQVGGDFMRGRLFVSLISATTFAGALAVTEQLRTPSLEKDLVLAGSGCLLLAMFAVWLFVPDSVGNPSNLFVVNERQFYPGYSLKHYLENGRLDNPAVNLDLAELFRNYAQKCGHLTIHVLNPGTLGYFAGPDVTLIDTLGLTDAFIAKLPSKFLASQISRPGHPIKYIPLSYLIERKDLGLLPNWCELLQRGDCSLSSQVENQKHMGSDLYLPD